MDPEFDLLPPRVTDVGRIHELLVQHHLCCELFGLFGQHVSATINLGDNPTMQVIMVTYLKGDPG
eukprot:2228635-Rhodomonas_salina.1